MVDDVFISAKSADFQYAIQVYRYLAGLGVRTFFSRESLPELGNSDYRKEIDKKLDEVQHMVVVVSSVENAESPWVEAEWGFFINEKRSGRKKGNLITVTVGSLQPAELPASLRYHEVIPFGPDAFEKIARYVTPVSRPEHDGAEPLSTIDETRVREEHVANETYADKSACSTGGSHPNRAAVILRRTPWRSVLVAAAVVLALATYWFWVDISSWLYPPPPPDQLPNTADLFPPAEDLDRPPTVPPKDVTFAVANNTGRDLLLLMINCEAVRRGMKETIDPFQPGPLAQTGKITIAAGGGFTKNDFGYGNGWFVFYVYDSRRGWLPYSENGRAIGARNVFSHKHTLLTLTSSTDWRFPYVWTFTPDASLPKSNNVP
jgi:TIR domain